MEDCIPVRIGGEEGATAGEEVVGDPDVGMLGVGDGCLEEGEACVVSLVDDLGRVGD